MRQFLMTGAAVALLCGPAMAQMQGGPSGQNMDQQMQNMQRQNPRMQSAKPDQDQPGPQEQSSPNDEHQMQRNIGPREGDSAPRHVATPTKVLSGEQKTRIEKTVIESGRAPRLDNITFNVSVGTPIPRTIRVVPVPEEIVSIYPEWSGFLYFVSGDDIIVVDPISYSVVGVLEA
jgi:hypothetical protein